MITEHKFKSVKWIDVRAPSADEVRELKERFSIHPLVANELLSPTLRPKVDRYKNLIYLILHFPVRAHRPDEKDSWEVDFIIGKDFLLTAHYDEIPEISSFAKEIEMASLLDKNGGMEHAGFLFFHMMRHLYGSLSRDLESVSHDLKDIEERIFTGEEVKMVRAIARANHAILDYRRALKTHREVLVSLEDAGREFFGESFRFYLRSITGEYYKNWDMLETSKEVITDLRDTNDSLLTNQSNETMKTLSMLALMTLPASLIATIFNMNVNLPIVGARNDFWIVVGFMLALTFIFFLFFKHKRWL